MHQSAWRTEDLKPQPLRSGAEPGLGEPGPLQRREYVVGDERQPQPRRIGAEARARHHTSSQVVLHYIVQRFNRTGLLAMPFQQFLGLPLPLVARHREVSRFAAVGGQPTLPFADADGGVAQWSGAFGPFFFLGPVVQYVGAFRFSLAVAPIRLPQAVG